MKSIFVFIFLLFNNYLIGQSIYSRERTGSRPPQVGAVSAYNPWIGSKIALTFGKSTNFSDNLIASGNIIHEIDNFGIDKFMLPVSGNISALTKPSSNLDSITEIGFNEQTIMSSNTGIHVGLYPYYILKKTTNFYLIAHSVIGWKINGFRNKSNTVDYLNQFILSIGMEMGLGKVTLKKDKPLTISVAPYFNLFSKYEYNTIFNSNKENQNSLQLTGVLPFASGFGILFEEIIPFDNSHSYLTIGLILTSETN